MILKKKMMQRNRQPMQHMSQMKSLKEMNQMYQQDAMQILMMISMMKIYFLEMSTLMTMLIRSILTTPYMNQMIWMFSSTKMINQKIDECIEMLKYCIYKVRREGQVGTSGKGKLNLETLSIHSSTLRQPRTIQIM